MTTKIYLGAIYCSRGKMPDVEYAAFAGTDLLQNHRTNIKYDLDHQVDGWNKECDLIGYRRCVKIELPHDVMDGEYTVANVVVQGLYGEYDTHDGTGKSVQVVTEPVEVPRVSCNGVFKYDSEAAFDKIIENGVYLSVPRKSGRKLVRVKVVDPNCKG